MSRPNTSTAGTFRAENPQEAHEAFKRALHAVFKADKGQVDAAIRQEHEGREAKREKGEK